MKAIIDSWNIEDVGPAPSTRREEPDGSVTYDALSKVTLNFVVIGNDAREFLDQLRSLRPGARIQEIQIGAPPSKLRQQLTGIRNGRKYVFE